MKKILIFSLVYYPNYIGGAEVAIKEITDRIAPSDYEFHMITLRLDSILPTEEKIGNVTVYRIGWSTVNPSINDLVRFPMYFLKVFYPVIAFFKAISLDRKYHYDGCWAMMSYMGFPIVLLRLFYRFIPYLLTLQEGDTPEYMGGRFRIKIIYPLYSLVFRLPNIVQAISVFLGSWARDMGFKGSLEVVPNGVDVAYFSQTHSDEEINEIKKELGKKEGDIYLVTTSRLVRKNACDDVISSLSFLSKNIHLVIIGIGPDEEKLKLKTKNLKLESRVKFLGEKKHRDLPKYLKACDIFIRPSLSEGMGNVFIEAMAAGLPVIATPVGGIVDFLKDGETGLFCNVRDPKSIALKVELYLKDRMLRERIISNALKMVREKYDWNLIAQTMKEKVFDRLFTVHL